MLNLTKLIFETSLILCFTWPFFLNDWENLFTLANASVFLKEARLLFTLGKLRSAESLPNFLEESKILSLFRPRKRCCCCCCICIRLLSLAWFLRCFLVIFWPLLIMLKLFTWLFMKWPPAPPFWLELTCLVLLSALALFELPLPATSNGTSLRLLLNLFL